MKNGGANKSLLKSVEKSDGMVTLDKLKDDNGETKFTGSILNSYDLVNNTMFRKLFFDNMQSKFDGTKDNISETSEDNSRQ